MLEVETINHVEVAVDEDGYKKLVAQLDDLKRTHDQFNEASKKLSPYVALSKEVHEFLLGFSKSVSKVTYTLTASNLSDELPEHTEESALSLNIPVKVVKVLAEISENHAQLDEDVRMVFERLKLSLPK